MKVFVAIRDKVPVDGLVRKETLLTAKYTNHTKEKRAATKQIRKLWKCKDDRKILTLHTFMTKVSRQDGHDLQDKMHSILFIK